MIKVRALTTTATAQLPYRVDHGRLLERAAVLRLADLIADIYRDPDEIIARAAATSRFLVTVLDHGAVCGFMFVRIDALATERAACLALIGVDPAHRVGGTATTLLEASDDMFDASVAWAWTATAHPRIVQLWAQHFAARTAVTVDPALALQLWAKLGAVPSALDPAVCKSQFGSEYTPAELASISRANRAHRSVCSGLDAGAGDRRLLVARRR